MSNKIKVALCGSRGQKFGRKVNSYEESKTVSVWDPDPESAKAAAMALGCRYETDYDVLLRDPELTGVVITVPNTMHTEYILKTIAAGKNVFLEKPLCLDVDEAYQIRDAVKQSGVKFFMSDPFVNASTIYIRDFIKSGRLGKLLSVRIRFCSNEHVYMERSQESIASETRRMGGGMMSGTGGHPLHIVNYLLGKPEKLHAVFAYGSEASAKAGWEEYIAIMMEYPDEVVAFVEAGKLSPSYVNGVEVCGTKGIITDSGVGDRRSEVRYRLSAVTEADLTSGKLKDALNRGDWVTVPTDKLPPEPDDHIRYWVKMQAYDIPNEQVGIDNASTHGVGIDNAVELVEMREAIYKAATTGGIANVR